MEDVAHAGAGGDDVVEVVAGVQLLAEGTVFVAEGAELEGFGEDGEEVVDGEGFGEEVLGACLHGFDGGFDGAEGGHDDDGEEGAALAEFAEEGEPVFAGEAEVSNDDVGAIEEGESQFGGGGEVDVVAGVFELELHDAAEPFFILDDQDA
jgi:hypothetical protein